MEWGLLFLLLPVAALSGWYIGRRGDGVRPADDCSNLSTDYFKGLNYLLNEQSDKAIEVFVHMLEIDSETVDIHFALGGLFLRRGEVDRAIRIHQNLIARPTLTSGQRHQALYELGRDYLRAGLLDRAELLFNQISGSADYGMMALRQLLEVYQLEKEWGRACEVAQRIVQISGDKAIRPVIAHFFCEQAEESLQKGDYTEAANFIRKAQREDDNSVRATLLESRLKASKGEYRDAIASLRKVEQQDPLFISESLPYLTEYYLRINTQDELIHVMEEILSKQPSNINVAALLARQYAKRDGEEHAVELLYRHVSRTPSLLGISELLQYKIQRHDTVSNEEVEALALATKSLLDDKQGYRCTNCGFSTHTLHWQCPSCKRWNTIKPVMGIESE